VEDWERRPVESVSWDRVQGFLEVLRRRLPKNWEVDLPTEAQWEYADRGAVGVRGEGGNADGVLVGERGRGRPRELEL